MSLLPYYDFERPYGMMERMERDFRRNFFNMVPSDFYTPSDQFFKPWENVFRPWEQLIKPHMDQLSSAMNQLALRDVKITADDDKFQLNVDVQHFAPEEIKVKVVDGDVMIEGKHEERRDGHGYVSRQFLRRYTLPQGCLPDTVESKLSSDGILTITAPKVLALPSIGERIIPVKYTGPVQRQWGAPKVTFDEGK